ncbi:MAG: helix-turn-helix transcriptional regulator [Raineya sp.]|nr:helix-turn-helix transcriptional regulator [Raineya sp.]
MAISLDRVGEQIKKFRELRNYTQEYMASKLEMSTAGYGKIERNEVEITLQKLQKIADILNTTIQDILGFEDSFVFNNREVYHSYIGSNFVNSQEIKDLYEKRLADKDQEIARLQKLLEMCLQSKI